VTLRYKGVTGTVAKTILIDLSGKINANGKNRGNAFVTSRHVLITKALF